jgi:hypothetical protein
MSEDFSNLQSAVLFALAGSPIEHKAKAAILFQEAITELRTGVASGEFTCPHAASSVWAEVALVVSDQANAA